MNAKRQSFYVECEAAGFQVEDRGGDVMISKRDKRGKVLLGLVISPNGTAFGATIPCPYALGMRSYKSWRRYLGIGD